MQDGFVQHGWSEGGSDVLCVKLRTVVNIWHRQAADFCSFFLCSVSAGMHQGAEAEAEATHPTEAAWCCKLVLECAFILSVC